MSAGKEGAVLIFDLNFKLITKTDGVINFLNQFESAEINQSEFSGNVKFERIIDILSENKHLKGQEESFQKELDDMAEAIKLEICRRLKMLIAFEKLSPDVLNEDWQKVKSFHSILIDCKQQGLFDMIKTLFDEYNVKMGKRFAFEERYKPFTPNLNGKNTQNHNKTLLFSDHEEILKDYVIWLNSLEFEKVFKSKRIKIDPIPCHELPEDIIYEKIIPKIIDGNTLDFNVRKNSVEDFQKILDIRNYKLKELNH
ncbi:hypothetical protein [Marivirga arenosa]|uniref:Uncharacterized protein n=1 Tax=Marivirga arenosa TaxID=3059076 RepID=A0AA49GIV7_9BACT|nr:MULTISPECIES: hypothetical protein [unclassified Marivirga]WKK82047.2 hypothetical protein QYS47_07775 [Marivirga sp. BKB1-2]WKK87260.2 hypothetical protein QYS48_10980 [Marivirga sp. ABR2-2]